MSDQVEAGRFLREESELIPIWRASATVEGFDGTVVLEVDRDDGSLVHLDDRSRDQSSRLLSDEQFARFDGYATNPAQDRRLLGLDRSGQRQARLGQSRVLQWLARGYFEIEQWESVEPDEVLVTLARAR